VQQLSSSESQNPPVRISPPKQDAVINRMDMMKPENTDPVSPVSFREQEPEIRYERTLPSTEIVPPAEHPGPVVSDTAIAPPSGELERALDSIVTQGAPGPIVTTVPGTVVMAGNLVQPEKKKTQIYVVSKGDDLSKIAKKVYGEKEGNRWVNIKKIYSANSMVLNSMDDVRIGQELAIPELATEQGVAVAIQDIQKVALGEKETS
jgi:nucleoid-associated protein YgaU